MIKKTYLAEVEFINGVDEFKSYRNYTKKVSIDISEDSTSSYRLELDNSEIDEESISIEIEGRFEIPVYWRKINGKSSNFIEIYTDGLNSFGKDEVINLNYVALNNTVSDLYSIDYENGLLYLANETNLELLCSCQFYNLFLTGDVARQLYSEEYSTEADIVSLNNKIDTYKYLAVYNIEDTSEKEYITPVLRNVKLNYINTSEEESF